MLLLSLLHFNLTRRPWRWKTVRPACPFGVGVGVGVGIRVLLVLFFATQTAGDCPSLCECKWKSGKESVICNNASLTVIPAKLDAGTQVLDLTENSLGHVARDAFLKAELLNLQKVYLSKCKIKTMDRYAFRKLKNLVELDLSYNLLPAIPSHVFDTIASLRELKLSGNPIQRILNDAFMNVPQLVRLELADCRIGTIEPRAFHGIDNSLEWLKLDHNRLVDVKSTSLTSMKNLHGLELANNPWNCTCSILPLREWMLQKNIPHTVSPVCRTPPRLSAKPWARLDLEEFACLPEIIATQAQASGVEGQNVTMSCQVFGIPEPNVRWMFRGRVVANASGTPFSIGRKVYISHLKGVSSNLTILSTDVQDAGVYTCAAENKAGKVESSVTLTVHRRPPDTSIPVRVLIASIVVAALFVLASCLVVLCVCSVRRRQHNGRWPAHGVARNRDDSYEKIEMNHKTPASVTNHSGNGSRDIVTSSNSLLSGNVLEVAVVGPTKHKRLGQYRGVPSIDTDVPDEVSEEEGGYEDAMETPTPTTNVSTRDAVVWGNTRSPIGTENHRLTIGDEEMRTGQPLQGTTDLHIPRASEYLDNRSDQLTPDGAMFIGGSGYSNSTSGSHNHHKKNFDNSGVSTISNFRSDLSRVQHHVMRKQMVGNNGGSLYTSALADFERNTHTKQDINYPDLLEISPYNLSGAPRLGATGNMDSPFCTLPRRRPGFERGSGIRGSGRQFRTSESQSPLLPDSRYASSGGEGSSGSNSSIRRSSIDAYQSSYYPMSSIHKHTSINQRSSSSVNLASQSVSFSDGPIHRSRKNPSLPSSPVRENHPGGTPLISLLSDQSGGRTTDFLGNDTNMYPSPTSSSSTVPSMVPPAAAYTFDYHATQLERFLEEYRSLQEQLCKMKETCENIRHHDSSSVRNADNFSRYGDPILYNSGVLTPSGSEDSNPKSILKKPASVAVTAASASSPTSGALNSDVSPVSNTTGDFGSDLSPYWLPRNTLLRRLSGGDFFQS